MNVLSLIDIGKQLKLDKKLIRYIVLLLLFSILILPIVNQYFDKVHLLLIVFLHNVEPKFLTYRYYKHVSNDNAGRSKCLD